METREMEYNKAGWVKYSNRLLPRYCGECWTVWITPRKGQGFRRMEEALIYGKLLKLEKLFFH